MDTPPPKTLTLEAGEWRALTLFSLQALLAALEQIGTLEDAGAAQAQVYLDRSRQLIEAWRRASATLKPVEPVAPAPNGPVKVDITKGKEPNGRRRRRNQVVTQPN